MTELAISIQGLSKTFGPSWRRTQALEDANLTVQRGEVVGLIGPNGAGKTTLQSCVLGLLRPDAGVVEVGGLPPDALTVRRRSGHLPERLGLPRRLTGRRFLGLQHALARLPRSQRWRDVDDALTRVGLGKAGGKRIATYSRGMLQRLAFTSATLAQPEFLFLDEPTSGMDPLGALWVLRTIQSLRERGTTVLLNSHQLDHVERVCDRAVFIRGGHIEGERTLRGTGLERVLVVRLASGSVVPQAEKLELPPGSQFLGADNGTLRFLVGDDTVAAAVITALATAGAAVAEAGPERLHLESLFNDPR